MSSVTAKIPEDFKNLSSNDRIDYVQGLWDFIAKTPDQVPMPKAHKQILDQRLADFEADPNLAKPWEQVRNNILKKLQNT